MFAISFFTYFLIVLVVWLFGYNRRIVRSNKLMPPGPPCLPVVGSLPFLGMNGHRSFRDLSAKYGPVIYLKMGSYWTVVLNSFDMVEEAFIKQSAKFVGRYNNFFTDFVADNSRGMFYLDGKDKWSTHRRFVLKNLFGTSVRPHMEGLVVEEVEFLQQKIFDRCNNPYNIEQDLTTSISNIISKMMFNSRCEENGNEMLLDFIKTSCTSCRDKSWVISLLYVMPWTRFLPGFNKHMVEMKEGMDRGYEAMDKLIRQHLETYDPKDMRDFLDHYLAECKANREHFNKRQLIQFLKDVFVAGTETSASTVRWILLMLVKHPEIQQKIHEEIDQAIGKDGKLHRNLDLPYTKATIHEVMRSRTVVPLSIPRTTVEDTHLNGYLIPKGTQVIPNLWAIHNDPDVWEDPSRFDPTRHLSNNGQFVPNRKVIPFSLGARNCLGASLARMEILLYTVGVLQHFQVRPNAEAAPDVNEIPGFINSPLPYDFVFKPR